MYRKFDRSIFQQGRCQFQIRRRNENNSRASNLKPEGNTTPDLPQTGRLIIKNRSKKQGLTRRQIMYINSVVIGSAFTMARPLASSAQDMENVFCNALNFPDIPSWAFSLSLEEFVVPFDQLYVYGKTYQRKGLLNIQPQPPVLVLGGGTQGGSDTTLCQPMNLICEKRGTPVYYYDMSGSGQSLVASRRAPYIESVNMNFYVQELLTVITKIKDVDKTGFHIVANSFGGMLALSALDQIKPKILTLTLSNTPYSTEALMRGRQIQLSKLSEDVRNELLLGDGDVLEQDKQDYKDAMFIYSGACISLKQSYCVQDSLKYRGKSIKAGLWNNSYFQAAGTLSDWAADPAVLETFKSPVMYIAGSNEEVTRDDAKALVAMFPNAFSRELKVIKNCGSFSFIDNVISFTRLVKEFTGLTDT